MKNVSFRKSTQKGANLERGALLKAELWLHWKAVLAAHCMAEKFTGLPEPELPHRWWPNRKNRQTEEQNILPKLKVTKLVNESTEWVKVPGGTWVMCNQGYTVSVPRRLWETTLCGVQMGKGWYEIAHRRLGCWEQADKQGRATSEACGIHVTSTKDVCFCYIYSSLVGVQASVIRQEKNM